MVTKFIVYKDKAKKFRFRLLATNGEIIATGEAYESKASCLKGIKSVQTNAPKAEIVDETIEKKAQDGEGAEKKTAEKPASKKPAAKKAKLEAE